MFTIEEVKDEDQKMAVVDEVLKDLPEWFGIPESTQAYTEGAKICKFGQPIRRVICLAL